MPGFQPVLRSLVRSFRVLLVVALLAPVAAALIGLTVYLLVGGVEHSVWEHTGQTARWVLFVVGVLITPLVMPAYVAHGITRRTFAAAAGTGGLVLVLVLATAAYQAASLLVERAVFAAAGHRYALADPHLFAGPGQVHLVLAEYVLLGAAYLVGGWLVGAGYYRLGGWAGTAVLPLALLPMVGVELALGTGRLGLISLPAPMFPDLPTAAAIGAAAALLVAAAVAVRALTRTVPLRARRLP